MICCLFSTLSVLERESWCRFFKKRSFLFFQKVSTTAHFFVTVFFYNHFLEILRRRRGHSKNLILKRPGDSESSASVWGQRGESEMTPWQGVIWGLAVREGLWNGVDFQVYTVTFTSCTVGACGFAYFSVFFSLQKPWKYMHTWTQVGKVAKMYEIYKSHTCQWCQICCM